MKLKDFIQSIALGELKGSNYVELNSYDISEEKLPGVINALNQALESIFTAFTLKEGELTLEIQEGINTYYLDSRYAVNTFDGNTPKYILDTAHGPFQDDLLQITAVYGDGTEELSLNDVASVYGVSTPEYNAIRLKDGTRERFKYLKVVYRASHARIELNEPRNSNVVINVPASFNAALQSLTASLIYMNEGGEKYVALGGQLYGKYRNIIEGLKAEGIGNSKPQLGTNIKPKLRGWT